MSQRSIVSTAHTPPTHHPRLAKRLVQSLPKQNLVRIARNLGPILVALTFASAAHAQGTMDFSGAQNLMGTFNYRNDYVGVEQWSRTIVRDNYVYLVSLHQQHERFAKVWDNNLRLQGFAEAFEQQQTPRA